MTEVVAPPVIAGQGVTHIGSRKGWLLPEVQELWRFRELLYFIVWRDIKVRYKQTALGAAWAVIQPFTLMVVFTVFLSRFAHVPSTGVPYPISTYAALVPWTFFAASLAAAADSLVKNSSLVSKVYFPRILLPVGAAGSFVIDFLIAGSLLLVMMVWYSVSPRWGTLWALPLLSALALETALGLGILLSAVNVKYRDIRYVVPFLIQLWLFATPVAYPITSIPPYLRTLFGLNPMTTVVEGFRAVLLDNGTVPLGMAFLSVSTATIVLVVGLWYFQRAEQDFADVI